MKERIPPLLFFCMAYYQKTARGSYCSEAEVMGGWTTGRHVNEESSQERRHEMERRAFFRISSLFSTAMGAQAVMPRSLKLFVYSETLAG